MTTEQQLIDAFDAARSYQPSEDLWGRVVHSIEEDRRHRRRVWTVALAVALTLIAAVAIATLSLDTQPGPLGDRARFDWRALEALEFATLVVLVASLGPAIRRFGRGYVGDIFPQDSGSRFLGLLDVAYYLLFSGYVLLTVRLSEPRSHILYEGGEQIEEFATRVGGLLLVMGLLHAATLMVLPLVGLVFNANRTGRPLPRWLTVLLIVAGVLAVLFLVTAGLPLVVTGVS